MNQQQQPKRHNVVGFDRAHSQVTELLRRHGPPPGAGVHLDVRRDACLIAEAVTRDHGSDDIGARPDAASASLNQNVDVSRIDLSDGDSVCRVFSQLRQRNIASITLLNVLEHVENPFRLLLSLRDIALEKQAPLIVAVPNVAHLDVGMKLAFGEWDHSRTGAPGSDPVRFFTDRGITETMLDAGWREIGRSDVIEPVSVVGDTDGRPALRSGMPLYQSLAQLRRNGDSFGDVVQLVRAYLPGPLPERRQTIAVAPNISRPFLSVVMRTQGRRLDTLRDALLCLTAQSVMDFEVLVIGHKLGDEQRVKVERVIEDLPETIRSIVRLHRIDQGERAAPLNFGFELAKGEYIAILDDDDLVMANWVETFLKLGREHPGRVLRAITVRQDSVPVETTFSHKSAKFVGSPVAYDREFHLFDHLIGNRSPTCSLAFPRGAFHDLGIRFLETLTTCEDWDFLMRVALICGVASEPEVTSIYRWWVGAESSQTLHSKEEWRRNHAIILDRIDNAPAFLAPGAVGEIRKVIAWALSMQGNSENAIGPWNNQSDEMAVLQDQLRRMLRSSSWRYTAVFRRIGALFKKNKTKRIKFDLNERRPEVVREQIRRVRKSLSWRLSRPFRAFAGKRKYEVRR